MIKLQRKLLTDSTQEQKMIEIKSSQSEVFLSGWFGHNPKIHMFSKNTF